MSVHDYPKFYRQRFLLFLLRLAGGSLSRIDFQKLLFLSHQKTGVHYYHFVPYHYGCYSFQAAADLEILHGLGWITLREHDIELLQSRSFDEGFKADESAAIIRFMRSHQDYRGRKLVRYVYEQYPYYAINSKMARDVLSSAAFQRVKNERRRLQSRGTALFTIGYEGRSFEEYVNILLRNDVRLLCDVRKNPISRKFGFSKGALSGLLPKLGVQYLHVPELGIVSEQRKHLKTEDDYKRLFDEYNRTISRKRSYLLELVELLETHERIALTCFEKQPNFCHRHCISDYLEKNQGIKVIHL